MARDFQNETQRSNLSARYAADSKTGTSRNLNDRSIPRTQHLHGRHCDVRAGSLYRWQPRLAQQPLTGFGLAFAAAWLECLTAFPLLDCNGRLPVIAGINIGLVAVALNFAVVGLVSLTDLAVRGRPKSRDAKVSCASARQ